MSSHLWVFLPISGPTQSALQEKKRKSEVAQVNGSSGTVVFILLPFQGMHVSFTIFLKIAINMIHIHIYIYMEFAE